MTTSAGCGSWPTTGASPVHMDGARVFNAAAASGSSLAEIAGSVDSIQFCLSKGLAAPVGSMVAGTRDFIETARLRRKQVGGAMRQAGVIAAAGLVALDEMRERLPEDHRRARRLAEGLAGIPGVAVDLDDCSDQHRRLPAAGRIGLRRRGGEPFGPKASWSPASGTAGCGW